MVIQTLVGPVKIGDYVEFCNVTKIKNGKVIDISKKDDITLVTIYHVDSTGGYSIQIPHHTINKIVKKGSTLEDIKKPTRYNKIGKLECWDVILDQQMNFLEGNILKYLWRYKEKNGVQDLKKAKVYLEKLIEELEK